MLPLIVCSQPGLWAKGQLQSSDADGSAREYGLIMQLTPTGFQLKSQLSVVI
jgi:hypothetical protein